MGSSEIISQQTITNYGNYIKQKGFEDVGHFLQAYVVSGGSVNKDPTYNNQINAANIVVSLNNDVMARDGTSFKTKIPSTTYYLDFSAAGDWAWGTSHPAGISGTDYLTVAEVVTDGIGNVTTITDTRGHVGGFLLKDEYGLENYATAAQLADITLNIKQFGAVCDGTTDDHAAIVAAIAATPEGGTLMLPGVSYNGARIEISKSINLIGKKPFWNGTNVVKGSVIKGAGIRITAGTNITISGIGVDCPDVANGFEILGVGISNVRFTDCVSHGRDHCYLIQSYIGLVKDVVLTRCEAHGGIHGFISKADSVSFTDCLATSCTANGYGIISDNISGTTIGQAKYNKLANCESRSCSYALNFYARDTQSDTNANGVECSYHTVSNLIATDCPTGIRIGDTLLSVPSGQTYLSPSEITISGFAFYNATGDCVEINQCINVTLNNLATNRPMNINRNLAVNLRIDNSVSDVAKQTAFTDIIYLPSGVTPSVSLGTGLFRTNSNGTITNLLDGKEDKMVTLVFTDDSTKLIHGGNFIFWKRKEYSGIGAFVVLKYQDGLWFDIAGNVPARGSIAYNLVTDGATAIDTTKYALIDVQGTGTTAHTVDFTGKNPDSEIVTLIIRSTASSFTYGGFNSSRFIVPSGFPLIASFGVAIMSQWAYMSSISKWVCVSGPTTAPYV